MPLLMGPHKNSQTLATNHDAWTLKTRFESLEGHMFWDSQPKGVTYMKAYNLVEVIALKGQKMNDQNRFYMPFD